MTTLDVTHSAALKLRHLTIGDVWRYRVLGSLDARPVTGTIVVSVMPDPDALMLVFKQTLLLEREPMPMPDGIFLFTQDAATGDLSIIGDNMGAAGQRRLPTEKQLFYPGRWSVTTAYDNRLDFPGGAFVRNTLAVLGQENVATPLGTHPAWIARFSSEGSAMGRLSGTDWWAPELGAPVRFETHSTMPSGEAMQIRATIDAVHLTQ